MRIRAATPGLLAVMMSGGCSSSGVLGSQQYGRPLPATRNDSTNADCSRCHSSSISTQILDSHTKGLPTWRRSTPGGPTHE
jgi:hypothetical protein